MKKTAGLTLYELLVAAVLVAIVTSALARAFSVGLMFPARAEASRERAAAHHRIESRLEELLRNAYLSADTGNGGSYFLGGTEAAGEESRITFTVAPRTIPGTALASTVSFEEGHERFGPIGGLREVSLGLTPVGEAGGLEGLFLREQKPADGDPTQGGSESVLGADVEEVSFEFFDGQIWQIDWDTRAGQRRLPAAVRVTYRRTGEDVNHAFVVRLIHSDVTPENPLVLEGTS